MRLNRGFDLYGWDDVERWNDFDPNLYIDDGKTSLKKLISESRLVVYSYDSTGLIESLSQNIPTVAFLEHGIEHLFDDAIPYYNLLKDAGIIHFDYSSIANHINNNWDNIQHWWYNEKTQSAILQFCSKYSVTTNEPVKELKTFFNSYVSSDIDKF